MELSRDVMIGMLRQGQTSDQILQILDVIVSQFVNSEDNDTVETTEFTEAEVALA